MIKINISKREVSIDGKEQKINNLDFDLLVYLVQNNDQTHTREELLNSGVWYDEHRTLRVVDQAIMRLRKLFGPESIKTILRRGYIWKEADFTIISPDNERVFSKKDVLGILDLSKEEQQEWREKYGN